LEVQKKVEERIALVMKTADKNKDGIISSNEFLKAFRRDSSIVMKY
jgi:Ca2+-binding EF-hand superfamily protein